MKSLHMRRCKLCCSCDQNRSCQLLQGLPHALISRHLRLQPQAARHVPRPRRRLHNGRVAGLGAQPHAIGCPVAVARWKKASSKPRSCGGKELCQKSLAPQTATSSLDLFKSLSLRFMCHLSRCSGLHHVSSLKRSAPRLEASTAAPRERRGCCSSASP